MVTLKLNEKTGRFDCYHKGERIKTLTCGDRFTLYCDDEDCFTEGKIECNSNGYYFTWEDGYLTYLYNGMTGTL